MQYSQTFAKIALALSLAAVPAIAGPPSLPDGYYLIQSRWTGDVLSVRYGDAPCCGVYNGQTPYFELQRYTGQPPIEDIYDSSWYVAKNGNNGYTITNTKNPNFYIMPGATVGKIASGATDFDGAGNLIYSPIIPVANCGDYLYLSRWSSDSSIVNSTDPMGPYTIYDSVHGYALNLEYNTWSFENIGYVGATYYNTYNTSGSHMSAWWSKDWLFIPLSRTVRIKNKKYNTYMNIEDRVPGVVECGNISTDWLSARWTMQINNDGYYTFLNNWNGATNPGYDHYLHMEAYWYSSDGGYAEWMAVGNNSPQPGWWSAQWQINYVETTNGQNYFRIQNRGTGHYLHMNDARQAYQRPDGSIPLSVEEGWGQGRNNNENDPSTEWAFETVQ